jgi:hypothetical protein
VIGRILASSRLAKYHALGDINWIARSMAVNSPRAMVKLRAPRGCILHSVAVQPAVVCQKPLLPVDLLELHLINAGVFVCNLQNAEAEIICEAITAFLCKSVMRVLPPWPFFE